MSITIADMITRWSEAERSGQAGVTLTVRLKEEGDWGKYHTLSITANDAADKNSATFVLVFNQFEPVSFSLGDALLQGYGDRVEWLP